MPTVARFRDEAGATRLSFNDPAGFVLTRGFDLGQAPLEQVWLSQQPYDGATLAASSYGIAQITVPVWLSKQANLAAVKSLMATLKTELERPTNLFEFIPDGGVAPGDTHLFDTYRSPLPSFFRGQGGPNPARLLHDTEPMEIIIYRHPVERSGKHI